MWVCKKCGDMIVAEASINAIIEFETDENGDVIGYNGYDLEEEIRDSIDSIRYRCSGCECSVDYSDDLKDIAEWEED